MNDEIETFLHDLRVHMIFYSSVVSHRTTDDTSAVVGLRSERGAMGSPGGWDRLLSELTSPDSTSGLAMVLFRLREVTRPDL